MGLGGISLWQLLIILVIVVVIFGTKRLGSMGKDLGGAVKGFRKAMSDVEKLMTRRSSTNLMQSSAKRAAKRAAKT
jgi:sec-independent protein translocase protein TatA